MDILIFSTAHVAAQIKGIYDASSYHYQVTNGTANPAEAKKVMETANKLLVIVDVSIDEPFFEQVKSQLHGKRGKIVVLTREIKQGFDYLSRGASEMIVLPVSNTADSARQLAGSIIAKTNKLVKEYDQGERSLKHNITRSKEQLIVMGASTGGTEILLKILQAFPKDAPPVLIVQHMPPVFTKMYAQRLNSSTALSVWEAQDGDALQPGLVLLAPGGFQMRLKNTAGRYHVAVTQEPPHSGHAPSVDLLFQSVCQLCPRQTIGVILTGMGSDGAEGLLSLRKAGAYTLGQDEPTSIVYGMPKVAQDIGAVMKQGSPDEIAQMILAKL